MDFACVSIKIHFHIDADFALRLALKQRLKAIRKWPFHLTRFFKKMTFSPSSPSWFLNLETERERRWNSSPPPKKKTLFKSVA